MNNREVAEKTKLFIKKFRLPLGIGLIGLIGLLTILALLITVSPNKKIIAAMNTVIATAEEIRQNYRSRPDYWGLSTDYALKNKFIRQTALIDGEVSVLPNTKMLVGNGIDGSVVMPGMKSFDIIVKNLSTEDCVELASYSLSEEHKLGLLSISIKNETAEKTFSWGGQNQLPLLKGEAKKICRTLNAIIWTFE